MVYLSLCDHACWWLLTPTQLVESKPFGGQTNGQISHRASCCGNYLGNVKAPQSGIAGSSLIIAASRTTKPWQCWIQWPWDFFISASSSLKCWSKLLICQWLPHHDSWSIVTFCTAPPWQLIYCNAKSNKSSTLGINTSNHPDIPSNSRRTQGSLKLWISTGWPGLCMASHYQGPLVMVTLHSPVELTCLPWLVSWSLSSTNAPLNVHELYRTKGDAKNTALGAHHWWTTNISQQSSITNPPLITFHPC